MRQRRKSQSIIRGRDLLLIGLIATCVLHLYVVTQTHHQAAEPEDIVEIELYRGQTPPAGYVGYYCQSNGVKCHTETHKCWDSAICAETEVRRPAPPRKKKKVIAYAISVTGDSPGWNGIDGAAVLGHSAVRAHRNSSYDAALVAFVSPSVSQTGRHKLEKVGFRVLEKKLPVEVEEIQGKLLREKISSNGCCGAWELLKLYAWTLTEYHRVVHLDVDSLVLQNFDELFDDDPTVGGAVLSPTAISTAKKNFEKRDTSLPLLEGIYAQYTMDWNMAQRPWGSNPPVQGGFVIARPSLQVYEEMVAIVRKGDFQGGWGGTRAGAFYGGMTIQGLLPYYFMHYRPGTGREVRGCVYNNMASNPRNVGGFGKGDCRDGTVPPPGGAYTGLIEKGDCEDCRLSRVEDVKVVHFTICQKPWECHGTSTSCYYCKICNQFHRKWFEIREELERERGAYQSELYAHGKTPARRNMCRSYNRAGYIPIDVSKL